MNKFKFNRRSIGALILALGLVFLAYEIHQFLSVRLYNIVGLGVGVSSSVSELTARLGEPIRSETEQTGLVVFGGGPTYHYDGISFRLFTTPNRTSIAEIYITCPSYRLSGRDRLRVGSARARVEQALARPTFSMLADNFRVYTGESRISVEIDKWQVVTFNFCEDDFVTSIGITRLH